MNLITHSRLSLYRTCPRAEQYRYLLGYAPMEVAPAMRLGTAVHAGLEAWWSNLAAPVRTRIDSVAAAISPHSTDPLDHVRLAALMVGYEQKWAKSMEGWKVLAVERSFEMPLTQGPLDGPWCYGHGPRQPDLRGWALAGKIDAIGADPDGRMFVVEHKTRGSTLRAGDPYWSRLPIDGQPALYRIAAQYLGYDISGVLYDVISTIDSEPMRATPVSERKYTKDGLLYARQRAVDESLESFRSRLLQDITGDLDRYYMRQFVAHLPGEKEQHAASLWTWIQRLVSDTEHPRNPESCTRYGRACEYLPVCLGEDSLEGKRYRKLNVIHEEL